MELQHTVAGAEAGLLGRHEEAEADCLLSGFRSPRQSALSAAKWSFKMLPNLHLKTASPGVKISSGHTTTNGNGNGSDAVSGRGLAHRKWTLAERIAFAADVATGVKHLDLSRGQLCSIVHVTPAALRAELKARANGSGHEDAMTADAKGHIREAVNEVGLSTTIDLLSELEVEMQCEVFDVE
jgi:hypothetical protein